MTISLKELTPGEKLIIAGYEKTGERYREKLLSMGLTRGTEITFIKQAPLGDPVQIELRGFNLSLRKDEAEVLKLRRSGS